MFIEKVADEIVDRSLKNTYGKTYLLITFVGNTYDYGKNELFNRYFSNLLTSAFVRYIFQHFLNY